MAYTVVDKKGIEHRFPEITPVTNQGQLVEGEAVYMFQVKDSIEIKIWKASPGYVDQIKMYYKKFGHGYIPEYRKVIVSL